MVQSPKFIHREIGQSAAFKIPGQVLEIPFDTRTAQREMALFEIENVDQTKMMFG
jgi:hypothetical protein